MYKGRDNYFLEASSTNAGKPVGAGIIGGVSTKAFGTAPLATNTWTHLATTYDGAALKLYVNGNLVRTTAVTGTLATSANPLQIGGDSIYRPVLRGHDRRGPHLQHRPHPDADPDRHDHGDRVVSQRDVRPGGEDGATSPPTTKDRRSDPQLRRGSVRGPAV